MAFPNVTVALVCVAADKMKWQHPARTLTFGRIPRPKFIFPLSHATISFKNQHRVNLL
ncbi:MAG: hypothetical protein KA236_01595 [Verrucomicrobia bacterium]|nr:hypothetical protein [Verrucomicrobiota bacterium]